MPLVIVGLILLRFGSDTPDEHKNGERHPRGLSYRLALRTVQYLCRFASNKTKKHEINRNELFGVSNVSSSG